MDTKGLLYEVFSRMSAKSILLLTTLSKICSTFPSENFFLKKHSEQLLYKDDLGFFIQQDYRWGKVELHSLRKNEDKKSFYDYGVPHNSLQLIFDTTKILGSYNGLLLLKNTNEEDMRLYLCNPATLQPKKFGQFQNSRQTLIVTDLHLVFTYYPTPEPLNSLTTMENSHDQSYMMRIFKRGKPSSLSSQSSICLVRLGKLVFMAWVLDDYEMGSWTVVLNIRVQAMGLREPEPVICEFTIIINRRPTLGYGRLRHSVKAEEISLHGLSGCGSHLCFINYSNTLRPC
ncbi:hypothetical protein NE237_031852 [Protea cynaroides]|uniref:F-box associated domain-containing protein n=1 Tax=Protea cynaroides TaxID=273540 RepID=A0A9Q0R2Z8_9MAGN|nr:hypothetical protein NE237_031852 [Protea cynaroides]